MYQEMPYSAMVTAAMAEVAEDGMGITPMIRPEAPEEERARGERSFSPQKGHTEAFRSIRARQFGHIRCEVSYFCGAGPNAERNAFFNLSS